MSTPCEKVRQIGVGVLLGLVGGRLLFVLTRKDQVQVLPVPYAGPPVPPEPKPAEKPAEKPVEGPVLLTSNPIPVVTGRRYRAIMSVGFPFSLAATNDAVRKEAEDLGFSNVVVATERPSDFPGTRRGDYYLEARWSSMSTRIMRPNIPGLSLVEAWEG